MKMSPLFILVYAIALIGPVVLFTVILNNANERQPFAVFAVCIIAMGIAGAITGPADGKMKWVAWSAVIGAIEAAILVFAA